MLKRLPHRVFPAVLGALALGTATLAGGSGPAPVHAATDIVPLFAGCNNVATTWPAGTSVREVFEGVSQGANMESIWRYDNAEGRFYGWSPLPGAPNDYNEIRMRTEPVFICVRESGELNRPTI